MTTSYWDLISSDPATPPILLYGTGNGADKILDECTRRGIRISGIFASDSFVRDRYFRGFKVISYSEALKTFGSDFTILLSFGTSVPDVMSRIFEISKIHRLIIPSLPLYGGDVFDTHYYTDHKRYFDETRKLFADERSKTIFDDMIDFRLSGDPNKLNDTESFDDMLAELLSSRCYDSVFDGGAYTGETSVSMFEALKPSTVICVEADSRSYQKLLINLAKCGIPNQMTFNRALSDNNGMSDFRSSGSRGSALSGSSRRASKESIRTITIDSIANSTAPDLIKLDIEGAEFKALIGAHDTIITHTPDLIISLYHRTDDIYSIPLYVHDLLPHYKLYLRRVPCIPDWDLNLIAIK